MPNDKITAPTLTVNGETFARDVHEDLGERWLHTTGLMYLSALAVGVGNTWQLWVGDYDEAGADLYYLGNLESMRFEAAKQAVAQLLEEQRANR